MDRSFFTDLLNDELAMNVDDNWDDAALFGPYENEQALLYQYAECLSARAFLKMCNLPFKIEQRPNAEHMSPSGEVPFLKVGRLVVADYLPIVDLVAKKGVKLSDGLTDVEIGELHAHICLLEEVLKNAEMYISWMHEPTLRVVTKRRYGSVYPWPLSSILPSLKGRQVCNKLRSFGWADRTIEQVSNFRHSLNTPSFIFAAAGARRS
uniref:Mitochondrial outer membrane transport complex Sam37/metaxin N-terminal domain-containing protein n=1 Tax=Plectus sambesii TaxID=2011161 RepID=A0A914WTT6_9BILA